MKKTIKKPVDIELEVGKTYKTKFQTGEMFTINEARKNKHGIITTVVGFYERNPELTNCTLSSERLINEKTFIDYEIVVCDTCGESCENCKKNEKEKN